MRVSRLPSFRCGLFYFILVITGAVNTPAFAQTSPQPSDADVLAPAPSDSYRLRITGERVNVRSRPDVNSRIVGRVNAGDIVEADKKEYGWYRILPPPGVFSIVAAEYIARIDNTRGLVKVDTLLRVRVGSDVQPRDPELAEVQTRLKAGSEVKIVGRLDDQWLKIAPPADVRVYVWGDFAKRISGAEAARLRASKPARKTAAPTILPAETPTPAVQPASAPGRPADDGVVSTPSMAPGWKPPPSYWETIGGGAKPTAAPETADTQPPPPETAAPPQIVTATQTTQPVQATTITPNKAPAPSQPVVEFKPASNPPPVQVVKPPPPMPKKPTPKRPFDASGILRPTYMIEPGEYGLRYTVSNAVTHKRCAYVEIPPELGFKAPLSVGKYVGVHGQWLTDEKSHVRILRATHVVVLNRVRK